MTNTDTNYLRFLASRWRTVSLRHDRVLRDEDPGPRSTAIQLEWAANEIDKLRQP